jgi:hypothetical protein
MNSKTIAFASTAILFGLFATAARAADVVQAPAPKASTNNTISLEFSPEWKTIDSSSADDYFKLGYAHTFDNNIVWGGSAQYTWRPDTTSVDQVETSLGYKFKADAFTITPSATLGYGFGNLPKINPVKANYGDPEAYYAFNLAADLKLNDNWTWNVFNARYRNAFNVTWVTPKVATGVTYKINNANAIYANVGYAWKDIGNGAGLLGDKWNVAVGYKFSF